MNLPYSFIKKIDESFLLEQMDEILMEIEILDEICLDLEEFTLIHSNLESQQNKSDDSGFLNKKNREKAEEVLKVNLQAYLEIEFNDEQANRFQERMIECQRYRKLQTEKRKVIQSLKGKKKKYQPKHNCSRDIFNFCGVDIQVMYKPVQHHWGTCLVLPFENLSLESIKKITRNEVLALTISEKFREDLIKPCKEFKQILTFYCGKIFGCQEYKFVYLAQKPAYVQQIKLEQMVQNVIKRADMYRNTDSIVFPDFDWLGFQPYVTSGQLLRSITQVLHRLPDQKRIRSISICCSKKESYFAYRYWIRRCINQCWEKGLIPLRSDQQKQLIQTYYKCEKKQQFGDETLQTNCSKDPSPKKKQRKKNPIRQF